MSNYLRHSDGSIVLIDSIASISVEKRGNGTYYILFMLKNSDANFRWFFQSEESFNEVYLKFWNSIQND